MGVAKLTDQNTVVPESKYARIERERRYLLRDLPEGMTRADTHLQITDNYLTGTPPIQTTSPAQSSTTHTSTLSKRKSCQCSIRTKFERIVTTLSLRATSFPLTCFWAICLDWCSPKSVLKRTRSSTIFLNHRSRWPT